MIRTWWSQRQIKLALLKKSSTIQIEKDISIIGPLTNLTLGDEIKLAHNVYLHLGGMDWCQNKGHLQIGDHAQLGPNMVIFAAGPFGVNIGENFDGGPGVKIFSSKSNMKNFQERDFGFVTIGNRVTLFANVVVSPGVTIGDDVVIAANSVINDDIPSGCFAGGIPARVISKNIRP